MENQKSKGNNQLRAEIIVEKGKTKDMHTQYVVSQDQLKEALASDALKHQKIVQLRKERLDLKEEVRTVLESKRKLINVEDIEKREALDSQKKQFQSTTWYKIGRFFRFVEKTI